MHVARVSILSWAPTRLLSCLASGLAPWDQHMRRMHGPASGSRGPASEQSDWLPASRRYMVGVRVCLQQHEPTYRPSRLIGRHCIPVGQCLCLPILRHTLQLVSYRAQDMHPRKALPLSQRKIQQTACASWAESVQAPQATQRSEMGKMAQAATVIQRAWRRHRTLHQFGSFSPRR